jgi:hypothetical protein
MGSNTAARFDIVRSGVDGTPRTYREPGPGARRRDRRDDDGQASAREVR